MSCSNKGQETDPKERLCLMHRELHLTGTIVVPGTLAANSTWTLKKGDRKESQWELPTDALRHADLTGCPVLLESGSSCSGTISISASRDLLDPHPPQTDTHFKWSSTMIVQHIKCLHYCYLAAKYWCMWNTILVVTVQSNLLIKPSKMYLMRYFILIFTFP